MPTVYNQTWINNFLKVLYLVIMCLNTRRAFAKILYFEMEVIDDFFSELCKLNVHLVNALSIIFAFKAIF